MIGKVHHPGWFCGFEAPCYPSWFCFVTGSEMWFPSFLLLPPCSTMPPQYNGLRVHLRTVSKINTLLTKLLLFMVFYPSNNELIQRVSLVHQPFTFYAPSSGSHMQHNNSTFVWLKGAKWRGWHFVWESNDSSHPDLGEEKQKSWFSGVYAYGHRCFGKVIILKFQSSTVHACVLLKQTVT